MARKKIRHKLPPDLAGQNKLEIVLKCDVAGTAEAISASLSEIEVPGVQIDLIQIGVGKVSKSDVLMARTQRRPLAVGSLSTRNATLFAASLSVLSMAILWPLVNALTAFLTLASMVGYSVVYTIYLKRNTPQNIVIGGAAGAMPPVLGWAAVTGTVDPYALLLFAIVFVWTPPHFWALAIHRRDDYARAAIPMLPVTHGIEYTRLHVWLYTILLAIFTILPFATHMSGLLYLVSAVILNLGFIWHAWKLLQGQDNRQPMRTFTYSIWYLMGIFAALLVDHYVTV